MIQINNLTVAIDKKVILSGINLNLKAGETAVIFGPNGCGKTTLLNTIMGLNKYQIGEGKIIFKGKEINGWPIEKRAQTGIGLLWQKPPKVAGVTLAEILKRVDTASSNLKTAQKLKVEKFLHRGVNGELSGGEIKRSEMAQLVMQNPDLLLLDEPDSGVDVDNSKIIAEAISGWQKGGKSIILVTHSGNLLKHLKNAKAYVMLEGRIRCQGKPFEMFETIAKCGYQNCADCVRRSTND
jgi:Fe-S cluster assembly ATP-binding protein